MSVNQYSLYNILICYVLICNSYRILNVFKASFILFLNLIFKIYFNGIYVYLTSFIIQQVIVMSDVTSDVIKFA